MISDACSNKTPTNKGYDEPTTGQWYRYQEGLLLVCIQTKQRSFIEQLLQKGWKDTHWVNLLCLSGLTKGSNKDKNTQVLELHIHSEYRCCYVKYSCIHKNHPLLFCIIWNKNWCFLSFLHFHQMSPNHYWPTLHLPRIYP